MMKASVIQSREVTMGRYTYAELRPRGGIKLTIDLDSGQAAAQQWNVVVDGHVVAYTRDERWARRIADAVNKDAHPDLLSVEKTIRGLIALGY